METHPLGTPFRTGLLEATWFHCSHSAKPCACKLRGQVRALCEVLEAVLCCGQRPRCFVAQRCLLHVLRREEAHQHASLEQAVATWALHRGASSLNDAECFFAA
ncbi:unnamed protein product [Polarella glacialis]|uniref:Uncharacterized protein n=1 Tax=Polarella glacialis TaxID=89957 RepID=A0A813F4Z5_POLGL|nr:unnamed protein product [Polarella glacialis]